MLNGKKGVSIETRERVQRIITELNYTPNVNSRRLILQRSFNLLVCLDTGVSTLENLSSYMATRYLIENGHKKIAFIGMERLPDFYLRAFGGYRRALSEANLPIQLDWIQSGAYDERSARLCMERILACHELPTAIYCASDIFSVGAMNFLQEHSYRIPEDISLVGADDIVLSRYYHLALTTVHIDKQRMGTLAVEKLDDIINGCEREKTEIIAAGAAQSVRRLWRPSACVETHINFFMRGVANGCESC